MKRLILSLITLSLAPFCLGSQEGTVLPEIVRPFKFRVQTPYFYISQGIDTFIYTILPCRLVAKVGKEGEGPGEILLDRSEGNTQVALHTEPGALIVRAINKLIYYTADGRYQREINTAKAGNWLCPLEDGFVGKRYVMGDDGKNHHQVFYLDQNLKLINEIFRQINGWQGPQQPFNPLLTKGTKFECVGSRLFVLDSFKKEILAYDKKGRNMLKLTHSDIPVPFSDLDREQMIEDYKTNPIWKQIYDSWKRNFVFPDVYTPIHDFEVDAPCKEIYMATNTIRMGKRKWFIFDFEGRNISTLLLPIEGLYQFHQKKTYRLLEDDDGEWTFYSLPDLTTHRDA